MYIYIYIYMCVCVCVYIYICNLIAHRVSVSSVRGCVLAYARVVVLVRVHVHPYVK